MTPKELLHIAIHQEVDIEPTQNIPNLHFLEKDLKNLYPLSLVKVPLFCALTLKKSNLCRIRLPYYLYPAYLEELIAREKDLKNEYAEIYPYLFELSEELIANCYNVEEKEKVRILVKDLKDIRFRKTYEGLSNVDGKSLNLNNFTSFEFNEIKPFILRSMEKARELEY